MTIYKYPLSKAKSQLVKMPSKSEIIDIQIMNGKYFMWAIVDDSEEIEVCVRIIGTGWKFPNDNDYTYLKTIHDNGDVWHFFMD